MTRVRHGECFVLPPWARWAVYGVSVVCAASGTGWLLLHEFLQVDGPFGPGPHPLEHPLLVVHGIAAASMLWVFGLLWLPHAHRAWRRRINRSSGGAMVSLLVLLGATGLGLYYLADDAWRGFAGVAHWVIGLVAVAWLPFHVWKGRRDVGEGRQDRQ